MYRATISASSNAGAYVSVTIAAHDSAGNWLATQKTQAFRVKGKHVLCQVLYRTISGTGFLNFGIRLMGAGSITIDQCTFNKDESTSATVRYKHSDACITYPYSEVVDSFTPTIAFTDAPHTAYEAVVTDNSGIVWDSGIVKNSGYSLKCGAVLKPSGTYRVKVRVMSAAGWLGYGPASEFKTPSGPIVRIISPAEGDSLRGPSALVRWKSESSTGITGQWISVDGAKPVPVPTDAGSYSIDGLNAGVHSVAISVKSAEGARTSRSRFYARITPAPGGTLYVYDMTWISKYDVGTVDGRKSRFDHQFAVAALQGLVNRRGPILYLIHGPDDTKWLNRFREPGNWLANKTIVTIPDLRSLFDKFRDCYKGAVVWDRDVYATSHLATTVAGADDLIPVLYDTSDDSMYSALVTSGPKIQVKVNLVGRFTGSGTIWGTSIKSTGSRKNDAYIWARENYLKTGRSNPSLLHFVVDAYAVFGAPIFMSDGSRPSCDYVIRNKGFAFDLDVWGDEKPIDDPNQTLGLDLSTLRSILAAASARTHGMIHCLGFIPFPFKYSNFTQGVMHAGGKHEPVPGEWQDVWLISSYNAYLEPDSPPNCSLQCQFPLPDRLTQNPLLSRTDLRKLGYLNARNQVSAINYLNLYMGDYDCSLWMMILGDSKWSDPNRGQIPISWGFNPNLAEMIPAVWEYCNRTRTDLDSFIAGDSGAGYVNPSRLIRDRDSGLPSAKETWVQHNLRWFRLTNEKITGFAINGIAGPITEEVDRMCAKFSPDGTFSQQLWYPQGDHMVGSAPGLLQGDLGVDGPDWWKASSDTVSDMSSYHGAQFLNYRTILATPTSIKNLYDGVTAKDPSDSWALVDARTYTSLERAHMHVIPDGRATYTFDTIPTQVRPGAVISASIGVRNDGWITWQRSTAHLIISWKRGSAVAASQSIPLRNDVASSNGIVIDTMLHTPKTPGVYTLSYEMAYGSRPFTALGDYNWEKQVEVK
jgi:hypothetical protein